MAQNINIESIQSGLNIPVILTKESGTDKVLTDIIKEGIKEGQLSLRNEIKNLRNNVQEGFTVATNGQATFTETLVDSLDSVKDSIKDLGNEFDKKEETTKFETSKLKKLIQGMHSVGVAISGTINIANGAIEEFREKGMKSAKMFAQLYESGVLLENGFDISRNQLIAMGKTAEDDMMSFYDIASKMRLTTEEALKSFQQHSKLIARMRSSDIINADATFAKMHGSMLEKFGLTAKDASATLNYFNETTLRYNDVREMTQQEMIDSVSKTSIFMKKLALATGQSVEQVVALNKLREEEIVQAHLQAQDYEMYTALKTAGFSNNMIEAFMTGVDNQESIMTASLDKNMAIMMGEYRQKYLRGELRGEQLLIEASQDKRFSKDEYRNMDSAFLALANRAAPEFAKALMSGLKFENFREGLDIKKIENIFKSIKDGVNSIPESNSINNLQNLMDTEASIVKMHNAYDNLMNMTMENASAISTMFKTSAETVAGLLNSVANNETIQAMTSGANTFSNSGSDLLNGIVNGATGVFNLITGGMNLKTANNLKNMVPPTTPPKTKIPKAVKGLGLLASIASIVESGSVLLDFADKGVYGSIDDYKKNWSGWDYLNFSKLAAVKGGEWGDLIAGLFTDSPEEMTKKTSSMKADTLSMSFEEWSKKHGEKNKYMYDTFRDNMLLKQTGTFDKSKNQENKNSFVKDTVNQNIESEIKKETETSNKMSETSTYLQNISTKILSNEVFIDNINKLSSLQEQMLTQLKKITDMELTLTDKVVASQGR